MKLSHLSTAVYGLSSSTTLLAYTNYQRRYFYHGAPTTAMLTSTGTPTWEITRHRNTLRFANRFPSSPLVLNSHVGSSHNAHRQRQRRCLSSFSSIDETQISTYLSTRKQIRHLGRTQQQRRMGFLSSTTSDILHDGEAQTRTDQASTTLSSTTSTPDTFTLPKSPAFRLFYNDVYEVKLPPKHRFPMGKYRKVRERVQEKLGKIPSENVECDFEVSPLATFEELSTTHDPKYIMRFLEGDQTEREQRNVGFPWSTEGVNRALSSVGGTLAAACFVCDRQRQQLLRRSHEASSPSYFYPSWAAHIAGGTHHAFYDYGEGFSVFSDMAVAANVVLDRYPDVIKNNILMIDLDVHQGNGNAVLFQSPDESSSNKNEKEDEVSAKTKHPKKDYSDRVFTFSMHCSGNYFSQKQESDLDIELPIGCQDQAYLMTLNHWLKRFRSEHYKSAERNKANAFNVREHLQEQTQEQPLSLKNPKPNYQVDLIFFQAGVDILDDDRLGRMALSASAVSRRNELVYEFASDLGVPLVICMGGGYPKREDSWESIIDAHSDVYCGAHSFLSNWSARNDIPEGSQTNE